MKRLLAMFLCFVFLLSLSACGAFDAGSESESVSVSESEGSISETEGGCIPWPPPSYTDYSDFWQENGKYLPDHFVRYESLSGIGAFVSLRLYTDFPPICPPYYNYKYMLSDDSGRSFMVYANAYETELSGAAETFGNYTNLKNASEGEAISLHSDKYRDTWVLFENVSDAAYYYGADGDLTKIHVYWNDHYVLRFEGGGAPLSDFEFSEEENPVSCLCEGDFESFLAYFQEETE